jgi:hypothetical protein
MNGKCDLSHIYGNVVIFFAKCAIVLLEALNGKLKIGQAKQINLFIFNSETIQTGVDPT